MMKFIVLIMIGLCCGEIFPAFAQDDLPLNDLPELDPKQQALELEKNIFSKGKPFIVKERTPMRKEGRLITYGLVDKIVLVYTEGENTYYWYERNVMTSVDKELSAVSDRLAEIDTELSTLETRLEAIPEELETLEKEEDSLKDQLRKKNAELSRIKRDINNRKSNKQSTSDDLNNRRDKCRDAIKDLEDKKDENGDKQKELKKERREIPRKSATLKSAKKRIEQHIKWVEGYGSNLLGTPYKTGLLEDEKK